MNDYFFNKARAKDRAQKIREEAEQEQLAAQFTKQEQQAQTAEQQSEIRRAKSRATLGTKFRPQEN